MTATQQDQEPRSHKMKSSGQGRGGEWGGGWVVVSSGETMALGGRVSKEISQVILSFPLYFLFSHFPPKHMLYF